MATVKMSQEELERRIREYTTAEPPRQYAIASVIDPVSGELFAEIADSKLPDEAAEAAQLKQMRGKVVKELRENLLPKESGDW